MGAIYSLKRKETMNIIKSVAFEGSRVISTNNGDISLNENTGELIVRRNGVVRTRVNADGFVYSDSSGLRRMIEGAHPARTNDVVSAVSDPGVDVINELSRG